MSLNIPPIKPVKVIDPRLNIRRERDYVALKGASVNSWQQFPSTNRNDSSVQITCNPPSRDIVISRLVFKKFVFSVNLTFTNTTGAPPLSIGYFGPRAYALAAITALLFGAEKSTLKGFMG